jgi:hypothetical protein
VIDPIQNDASKVFRKLGLSTDLALLDRAWESEVGSLASMARIAAVDNGALVVEVVSSTAMQEINLRRQELLRRLNRYFPDPFIKQISVRMAQHG